MVVRGRVPARVAPAPAIRTVAALVDRATEILATFQRWKRRQRCRARSVVLVETLRPRGGRRFAAGRKSVKRAALRLCSRRRSSRNYQHSTRRRTKKTSGGTTATQIGERAHGRCPRAAFSWPPAARDRVNLT